MSPDQDEETIYADFNADAYNDLIEYQFSNIVKLMSGLVMGDSLQEKVLKELSANLAALMVVENWEKQVGVTYPLSYPESDTLQVKSPILVKQTDWCYILGYPEPPIGTQVKHILIFFISLLMASLLPLQSEENGVLSC